MTQPMAAFREEIFGPLLTVTRFGTVAEAIALASDAECGLANGVWSENIDTAVTIAMAPRSGTVYVNRASRFLLGGYQPEAIDT